MRSLIIGLCLPIAVFLGSPDVSSAANKEANWESLLPKKATGWNPNFEISECNKMSPDIWPTGGRAKPFVIDRTGTEIVKFSSIKSENFYRLKTWSGHPPVYRFQFGDQTLEICFGFKTWPDAVIIDTRPMFETNVDEDGQNRVYVTMLLRIGCGTECAVDFMAGFSFLGSSPDKRRFYKLKILDDPQWEGQDESFKKWNIAVFPPREFRSRLTSEELAAYKKFRGSACNNNAFGCTWPDKN